ncbi:hypothetical protein EON65_56305 [archaeon]|nr:MAG: hypothetical protein EON65_56305 [archaeon]
MSATQSASQAYQASCVSQYTIHSRSTSCQQPTHLLYQPSSQPACLTDSLQASKARHTSRHPESM